MSTTAPPLNTRAMPVQVVDATEAEGRIVARVLRYGVVDSYRTIFAPGCARRRLSERMPVALQAHNSNAPVGRAVRVVTDNEQELVLEFQFNMETQRGREAYSDAAGGFVPEWSVGFWVRSSESVTIDGERYDRFTDIDLDEVSLVYSGAVPGTETLAVRSQPQPLEAATQQAIAAFDDLLARFAERRESREREGRTLSDSQTSALKDLARRADALAQIKEPMPQPDNLARLDRELELRRKRITNK